MLDVLVVFGTRPELIKLAPVVAALKARGLSVGVVATGQHSDLLDIATLAQIGVVASLGVASDGSVLKFTMRAQRALRLHIAATEPRCVLVQGDTMSAHAGALAAAAAGVPVAHVEAGLRSGDLNDPWPEEGIRVAITKIATWHFAPTTVAALRIDAERRGKAARNSKVWVTGNTSVDALRALGVAPCAEATPPTVLVTLHRRELRAAADVRETLQALATAIAATPSVQALWPVHPAMAPLLSELQLPRNFALCSPTPHGVMVAALSAARGVLTDSGGVVEEAATLGVPTAVLRNVTDRPEAEEAGVARRFPPTPVGVTAAWHALATCAIARTPSDVYGDGHAAEYIARHLASVLK
jgi:UDP-N-acetylglucosamine 2-epimerase (non-hydrolysing)